MKKALGVVVMGLALAGFGCSQQPVAETQTSVNGTSLVSDVKVEGVWHLAFDLPKGWVMVQQYGEDDDKKPTDGKIDNQMTDVVLQSTDKIVALTGSSELAEGTFVTDDYTYIRAFRMDKSSIIPAEAVDVGNGFSKLEKGVNLTYYMKGEFANYKFVVYWDEQEQSVAEGVITSAKEVTDFVTKE